MFINWGILCETHHAGIPTYVLGSVETRRLQSQVLNGIGDITGATEAARGAADIVLTEPGLSTIVSAIIGARKIFQRMNTYAKYTIAMTFRICLTFGVLTVTYNWCVTPLPPI